MRKERIDQTRQKRSRPADGAQLPAVRPAAERDLRRQADAFIELSELRATIGRDPSERPAPRDPRPRLAPD